MADEQTEISLEHLDYNQLLQIAKNARGQIADLKQKLLLTQNRVNWCQGMVLPEDASERRKLFQEHQEEIINDLVEKVRLAEEKANGFDYLNSTLKMNLRSIFKLLQAEHENKKEFKATQGISIVPISKAYEFALKIQNQMDGIKGSTSEREFYGPKAKKPYPSKKSMPEEDEDEAE